MPSVVRPCSSPVADPIHVLSSLAGSGVNHAKPYVISKGKKEEVRFQSPTARALRERTPAHSSPLSHSTERPWSPCVAWLQDLSGFGAAAAVWGVASGVQESRPKSRHGRGCPLSVPPSLPLEPAQCRFPKRLRVWRELLLPASERSVDAGIWGEGQKRLEREIRTCSTSASVPGRSRLYSTLTRPPPPARRLRPSPTGLLPPSSLQRFGRTHRQTNAKPPDLSTQRRSDRTTCCMYGSNR